LDMLRHPGMERLVASSLQIAPAVTFIEDPSVSGTTLSHDSHRDVGDSVEEASDGVDCCLYHVDDRVSLGPLRCTFIDASGAGESFAGDGWTPSPGDTAFREDRSASVVTPTSLTGSWTALGGTPLCHPRRSR
jgi:hypothetical protein